MWSILTQCVTPQSGNRVSTSLSNSGLCWTVFAQNRDTAVPAEGNGDLQTLTCVLVARPRRCLTLLNPVPWQNWMAAYLGYTLRIKTLFRGWPVMVHDTHTRRRRQKKQNVKHANYFSCVVASELYITHACIVHHKGKDDNSVHRTLQWVSCKKQKSPNLWVSIQMWSLWNALSYNTGRPLETVRTGSWNLAPMHSAATSPT